MNTERQIAVINGPNLNLLGTREPEVYGTTTLEAIINALELQAKEHGLSIWAFQSNSEGALIDAVQQLSKSCEGVIINPGAYSHSSIAIRDALQSVKQPIIEVHISNIYSRESFRHHSYVSGVATGVICLF